MEINAATSAMAFSTALAPALGSGRARGEYAPAGQQQQLSNDEQRQVEKLKQRDREVRAHEAAHMAAGSGLVRGGASYQYQKGPDGKNYAVGGEVSIDSSPVRGDPEATLAKAQQIRAAAMAPADPSAQDRAVAAQAAQMAAQAQMEMARQRQEEGVGGEMPAQSNIGTSAIDSSGKLGVYSAIAGERQDSRRLLDMYL